MSDLSKSAANLPPEQQALAAYLPISRMTAESLIV
jgi:hypothetical protein